jgi:hypothetical protein
MGLAAAQAGGVALGRAGAGGAGALLAGACGAAIGACGAGAILAGAWGAGAIWAGACGAAKGSAMTGAASPPRSRATVAMRAVVRDMEDAPEGSIRDSGFLVNPWLRSGPWGRKGCRPCPS